MSLFSWLPSRKSRTSLAPARRSTLRRARLPLSLERLEDRTTPSTVTWIAGNGDWDTASNWSTGAVPGAGDDVDINVSGITITHNAATAHSVGSLTLEAGTLTGADALTVAGAFTWTGGTLAGTGSLVVQGEMNLTGPGSGQDIGTLDTRALTLEGNSTWSNGNLYFLNGPTVTNDGSLAVQGPFGAGTLDNAFATLVNPAGASITTSGTVQMGVGLSNAGSVTVQQGFLDIGGGTSSGSFVGAAGTTLEFVNGNTFTPTSTIQGDAIHFYGGPDSVQGSYQANATEVQTGGGTTFTGSISSVGALGIDSFSQADFSPAVGGPVTLTLRSLTMSGTSTALSGSDSFVVSGDFTWTGTNSTLRGASGSSLVVQGDTTLTGVGSGQDIGTLDTRALTLEGNSTWSNGNLYFLNGPTVTNDGSLAVQGPFGAGTLDNAFATLVNPAGASITTSGTVQMGVGLSNAGSVTVQQGFLDIGGGTSSGSFVGAAGTTLEFVNGNTFTPTSTIQGDAIHFYGGPDSVQGSYQANATEVQTGGGTTFTGSISSVGALGIDSFSQADFSPAVGGPVTLTLRSLTMSGTSTALSGSDSFVVSGDFTWTGTNSTLRGASGSSLVVQGDTTLTGVGSGQDIGTLDTRALTLEGNSTWSNGNLYFLNGPTVTNDGSLAVQGPFGAGTLDNAFATLVNPAGASITTSGTVQMGVGLSNAGSVTVQQGFLDIGGGTSSGSFVGAAGTTLEFVNGNTFTPTSTIQGDAIHFYGGPDSVQGSYQANATEVQTGGGTTFTGSISSVGALGIDSFSQADFSPAVGGPVTLTLRSLTMSGTSTALSGSDSFVVSGDFTWTGTNSTLRGASGSSLVVQGDTTLTGVGSGQDIGTLDTRALTLEGNSTWSNGNLYFLNGPTVTNDGSLAVQGPFGAGTLDNAFATLVNPAGASITTSGTVQMGVGLSNAGSVTVQPGFLDIGGGTSSGSFVGAAGTTLEFVNGNTFTPTSTIQGDAIHFYGGPDSVQGSYQANATEVQTGGGTTFTGSISSVGALGIDSFSQADFSPAVGGPVTLTLRSLTMSGTSTALSGSDSFVVSGDFTWTGTNSTLRGASGSSLVVQGDTTLTGVGSGQDIGTLDTRALTLEGNSTWSNGNLYFLNGPTVTNDGNLAVQGPFGAGSTDNAFATLVNPAGASITTSGTVAMGGGVGLDNAGSLTVQQGFLDIGGGTSSGSFVAAAGTTLEFVNGNTFTPTSTIQGDAILFSQGPDSVQGSYQANQTAVACSVTFSGTLIEQIGSPTQYSQIDVTGSLNLGAALQIALTNGYVPQPGTQFTIIADQTSQPINGTFSNLPEGGAVWDTSHTERFPGTYLGGDGNDLVLTATAPLTVKTTSSIMLVGNTPPPVLGSVNGTPFAGSIGYTTAYGDQLTVTLSTAATSGSAVGQYPITAIVSGANASDYFIDPDTSTTGTMYVVSVGADPSSATGAQAVTFWDNKGNAKLITASDLSSLDALNLVNQGRADFDPKAVAQLQAWLSVSPNASAAYQMAVQLAALDLNVLASYVQTTDLVYAGGLLSYASAYGISGLTSGGFIDVQDLMNAANAALAQVSPGSPSSDPNQAYELALAQVLQAVNANSAFVVQDSLWSLFGVYASLTS